MTEIKPIVVNAFGLNHTGAEIAKVVVIGRGNCQLQLCHSVLHSVLSQQIERARQIMQWFHAYCSADG